MENPQRSSRPNILFLLTDQQRWDTIGRVNPAVRTPNLDALADAGVLFNRAYTTCPSCVPARASLFTGKYPSGCGAPMFITPLPARETTFMSQLQEGGYHTAVVGKQHFAGSEVARGYDYEDIVDSHFPPNAIDPETNSYTRSLWEAGFRRGSELYEKQGTFAHRWKAEERFHPDGYVGGRGAAWLREKAPQGQPWYCCISFPGPHHPYDGLGLAEENLYAREEIPLPDASLADLKDKPPIYEAYRGWAVTKKNGGKPLAEDEIRELRHSYYANISFIDRQIGGILEALRESGHYGNTLILFTSDHGDYMGDFGMLEKGQNLAEPLVRVPLLMKPVAETVLSRREEALVSLIDIPATCLEAAGLPVSGEMQGESLLTCAGKESDDSPGKRRSLYMEAGNVRGLRTDEHKITWYHERDYGELYNLKNDPLEKRNLWNHPEAAETKRKLLGELTDHLIRVSPYSSVPWNYGVPEI